MKVFLFIKRHGNLRILFITCLKMSWINFSGLNMTAQIYEQAIHVLSFSGASTLILNLVGYEKNIYSSVQNCTVSIDQICTIAFSSLESILTQLEPNLR